ncbi:Nn.00g054760.m01.CDS01 [Neocucurbitaria sp. VM-36]
MPDLLSLYTENGVLMAPGFQPAVGTKSLKSSYQRIFSLDISFSIDEIVIINEEWAFARTTAAGTKHWLNKGTQESHHNQEIFICQKQENEWKIARYCFSSTKPFV